jgi:hypothetical protein
MYQLNLPLDGGALRDQGMEQVLENARAEWREKYRSVIDAWFATLSVGTTFSGEDLRLKAQLEGVGHPHHPNAWGSIAGWTVRRWLAENRVRIVAISTSKDPRAHAAITRIYEKVQ